MSDGASAIAIASEEGLKRAGIPPSAAVEIVGIGQVEADLTVPPADLTALETTRRAVEQAFASAGISGRAPGHGRDARLLHDRRHPRGGGDRPGRAPAAARTTCSQGQTARGGRVPFNTTGGLVGWGHPTGATGVHQAVTIWEQLTGRAGAAQIDVPADRPFGLSVNMGGDDKTLVAIVYRRGQ